MQAVLSRNPKLAWFSANSALRDFAISVHPLSRNVLSLARCRFSSDSMISFISNKPSRIHILKEFILSHPEILKIFFLNLLEGTFLICASKGCNLSQFPIRMDRTEIFRNMEDVLILCHHQAMLGDFSK